jgi:hypothetical protein
MKQKTVDIEALPIFTELVARLDKGDSYNFVAEWVQQCGHWSDVKTGTVIKRLQRFWGPYKDAREKQDVEIAVIQDSPIPEIQKLEALAQIQLDRVEMMHTKENEITHTFDSVRKDISVLEGLYAKLIDIKVRGGALKQVQAPASQVTNNLQVNIDARDDGLGADLKDVISNPASRRKLLSVLKDAAAPDIDPDEAQRRRFYVGTKSEEELVSLN